MLIDTHAHLYWEDFKEDLDEVVKRAVDAGVTTIINVGVDLKLSQVALDQVHNELTKYPALTAYSTIGIHPHEAVKYQMDNGKLTIDNLVTDIEKLENIYRQNPKKVIAVGECGLDYFFSTSEESKPTSEVFIIKNLQRKLFQAQIDLAKKLNLPLIIHCRDDRSIGSGSTGSPPTETASPSAWDETLKMVGNHPAILHCYSGLPPTTNSVLRTNNLFVSFAATITYPKNEYLREAAKVLPLDRIVLETDCPFLPPQSKRGQRNEPTAVAEIAQLIAVIKDVSFETVANQTTANTKNIFKI